MHSNSGNVHHILLHSFGLLGCIINFLHSHVLNIQFKIDIFSAVHTGSSRATFCRRLGCKWGPISCKTCKELTNSWAASMEQLSADADSAKGKTLHSPRESRKKAQNVKKINMTNHLADSPPCQRYQQSWTPRGWSSPLAVSPHNPWLSSPGPWWHPFDQSAHDACSVRPMTQGSNWRHYQHDSIIQAANLLGPLGWWWHPTRFQPLFGESF